VIMVAKLNISPAALSLHEDAYCCLVRSQEPVIYLTNYIGCVFNTADSKARRLKTAIVLTFGFGSDFEPTLKIE
jgi:hypothetical protein